MVKCAIFSYTLKLALAFAIHAECESDMTVDLFYIYVSRRDSTERQLVMLVQINETFKDIEIFF